MRKLKLFLDAKAANTPPRGISKASRVIFSVLTLLFLSIGQMWATEYTATYTVASASSVNASGDYPDGSSATLTGNANLNGSMLQLTYGKNAVLTISGYEGCTITGFKMSMKSNSSKGKGSMTLVAGETTLHSVPDAAFNTSNWYGSWSTSAVDVDFTSVMTTDYTVDEDENIVITVTNHGTSNNTNSLYIGSYTITYEVSSSGGSTPYLSVAPTSIDFGTVEKGTSVSSEAVAVTFANLTGTVTYSGLSSPFTASGAVSATGDEITIAANTSNVGEYEQTLTVQSTADALSKTVTVTMNVVEPFDGLALTFPDYNDKSVSSYTSSWTATKSGQVWTIDNFNNNSNGWSLIKAGRNGNASVASITTQVEDHAVSDVTVTIDGVTASKINSHKLYVADNSSFTGAIEITGAPSTIAAGNIVYTVPVVNRANDLYYKLEFNCASGSSNGFLQISKITYAYAAATPQKDPAGLAYNDADLSNLVKLGDAFTAPTLTNPHNLTVAYESSNTDVAEVASNGALTIKAAGVAVITASFAGNDDYKAGSASYTIGVTAHAGTEADPYTVADARVVIDKVGETGIADQYVAGIVSKIVTAFNSDFGNITYDISSDGATESAQLRAYRGFDKDGAWFTSEDDVIVGDEVVVKGLLKKYNTTYEFDAGNQLVSLNRTKAVAGLAYAETAVEKNIGDAVFTNALTNPNNLEVSYSSSATGIATVDENGEVTIVGMGTTTIKATFAGNGSYLADEVSYTLTVNDPSLVKVTFDATVDIASENAEGITKNGVNIKASHVDGVNGSNNAVTYYQCFKNATFTATCTSGNIKRIEFSCTSSNPASGFGESYADGVWTGDAAIVEITATVKQVQMNTVTVYYKVDARAEAGLAYAETAIEKHVGDETFVNALTNPNNLTVAYESSNTDVAEVAANGTVTIKAEGATTITASFDGDADYKPASVSYELTVNEAGLDNVTFNSSIDLAASGETTISKDGFTLTFSAGSMDGTYSEYRLHKSQTMTLSSTNYKIKKIEFTCTAGNPIDGFEDATGLDKEHNQWTGDANKVELTASIAQVRITQMIVYYVEDTRAASGLAWSTDDVEITLGDAFTAPNLVNPNSIVASAITIESDDTDLAVVNDGVVELVDNATGTAHITATFAGNETYKPASISYTIIVNDPTPTIYVDKLNVNFGSVEQDAVVADKKVTVTFTNVPAATLTLEGAGSSAFTISPAAAMTASGDITISASSANVGTFAATLTISDDDNNAESKVVNLSITVNEPVIAETPVSTSSKWVPATEIADGMQVLITGVKSESTYAMGASSSNGNNRTSVAGSFGAEDGAFVPGEGTMSFTLVATGAANTYYIKTSNNQYLYNASSSTKSYLKTKAEQEDVSWTIELDGDNNAVITSVENTNRQIMRFNTNGGNDPLFNCYASGQTAIKLYVPKPAPAPDYGSYQREVTACNYGTICLPQAGTIEGATLFEIGSFENDMIYVDEVLSGELEAGKPYIFQATADQLNVTYTSGDQVAAGDANGLHGFYNLENENATQDVPMDGKSYILYQNAYWLVSGRAAYIANFRAYIVLNDITPKAAAPGRRRVAMAVNGEQVATGMESIQPSEVSIQKVMIDGKLFIIRGEKMYNVNGQVVK